MKRKQILSVVIAAIMALSMSVTAFAGTNSLTLTYSNEASYEISIPESATINQSTGKGTIVVNIDDANLANNTAVSVTVTSDNYDDGWYLVNTNNESDRLAYTIGTTEGDNDIANGDEVIFSDSVSSTTLYVAVSDTSKVGTFTDTITFTSQIVKNIINFTIDGTVYQAEKGMTWAKWSSSDYNTLGVVIGDPEPNQVTDSVSLFEYSNGYEVLYSDVIEDGMIVIRRLFDFDF